MAVELLWTYPVLIKKYTAVDAGETSLFLKNMCKFTFFSFVTVLQLHVKVFNCN